MWPWRLSRLSPGRAGAEAAVSTAPSLLPNVAPGKEHDCSKIDTKFTV